MPRRDGTGPMGIGSMTGRGVGLCAGYSAPDYASPCVAYGTGCGGRGFRRIHYLTGMPGWMRYGYPVNGEVQTPEFNEKAFLSNRIELLEKQLQQAKKRLNVLGESGE